MERSIRLSSAEISGLWAIYLQESMSQCLLTYFIYHNQDEEIGKLLYYSMEVSQKNLRQITEIFNQEKFPVPDGFSEADLNLTVPPLFYDQFGLSYLFSMSRIALLNISFITVNIARQDVLSFFVQMGSDYTILYEKSTALLLEKGIYDRPPMIPYPDKVEYVENKSYLIGLGKKRPLNVAEISEIFFNIERNYFSVLLCMGLMQVVKDKEIHGYIAEGKRISEKQINTFNDLLQREELLGNVSVNMEVTTATESPFSDRLIVMLFHSLNSIDIALIGHALSLSMRTDLATYYQKYIIEILVYAAKGFNLIVDRGWMQKPPHAPDRRTLQKLV